MEEAGDINPIVFALIITLIVAPLTLFYSIMLPCWDCNDFEAAILHETGHFFGIGHPNNIPRNLQPESWLNQVMHMHMHMHM